MILTLTACGGVSQAENVKITSNFAVRPSPPHPHKDRAHKHEADEGETHNAVEWLK
ncbi:MAG: hypothetical protein ACTHK4_07930 [Mycobacteriales bacterium]